MILAKENPHITQKKLSKRKPKQKRRAQEDRESARHSMNLQNVMSNDPWKNTFSFLLARATKNRMWSLDIFVSTSNFGH